MFATVTHWGIGAMLFLVGCGAGGRGDAPPPPPMIAAPTAAATPPPASTTVQAPEGETATPATGSIAAREGGGMASERQDIDAMIAEMEASLADADPNLRGVLEQQIATLRWSRDQLPAIEQGQAELAARRPTLTAEQRAFFAFETPVTVPAWIADDATRSSVSIADMRCPAGAEVSSQDDALICYGRGERAAIPPRHGLSLTFYASTGKLRSQGFYENGLLRWAVDYHPSGGRKSVGFYVDTEIRVHLEDGVHTGYAPNGQITTQFRYRAGQRDGWSKIWESDGFPMSATRYEQGRAVEQRTAFDR